MLSREKPSGFERAADAFEGMVFEAVNGRLGKGQLGEAQPIRLEKAVLKEVNKAAKRWDDGSVLYPNRIRVYMGCEPWDGYYSGMLRNSRDRLAASVERHVREKGASVGHVKVAFELDARMRGCSVRIVVGFEEFNEREDKTPKLSVGNGGGIAQARHVGGDNGNVANANAAQPMEPQRGVRGAGQNGTQKMARPSKPSDNSDAVEQPAPAQVEINGEFKALDNGMTIGMKRDPDRPTPNIQVSGRSDVGTSQMHGQFLFDGESGTWTYRNLGRNGSRILRGDSQTIQLSGNESACLYDGDKIILGPRGPVATFLLP